MKKYVIITDSTSDLDGQIRSRYGIDYLKMGFASTDKSYEASLDWDEISAAEFYKAMRDGVQFKTSQVPMTVFISTFGKYLKEGFDILYIGCSSALSGSVKTAELVRESYKKEFPSAGIYCFDSLLSGMGQGLMVIKAAELREAGESIEDVYNLLEKNRMSYSQCGTTGSLEYLKRAGRVTASSAFFGDLFAVKPLIISDAKGQNLAISKVKGRGNALVATADHVARYITEPDKQTIWIGHADCEKDAEKAASLILDRLPGADIKLNTIGAIVGASVGPGTIIVYYTGVDKSKQTAVV